MKSILYIEDEAGLQKAVSAMLEADGFGVFQAVDGEIGLRIAKDKKPDLIVLDLILPRKDGFSVLEELKADSETVRIPVVILTNLESISDIEKAMVLGAKIYLVKANYSLKEAVAKIKETIQTNAH